MLLLFPSQDMHELLYFPFFGTFGSFSGMSASSFGNVFSRPLLVECFQVFSHIPSLLRLRHVGDWGVVPCDTA